MAKSTGGQENTYPNAKLLFARSQEEVPVGVAEEPQEASAEEIEPEAEAQECPDHRPSTFEKGSQEEVPVGVAEELQEASAEEIEPEVEAQECPDHRPSTFEKDVKYKKAGYISLMKSLTHHEVTHKFKTLVRVVAAHPCEASLLSTGNCHLRLTLEDPTARIHAYVYKDDVVEFFGGGFLTTEVIIKKMNMLLGILEPQDSVEVAPLTRNPPWIWCCLKSYYQDKNDPRVGRRYRIFGTAIRD